MAVNLGCRPGQDESAKSKSIESFIGTYLAAMDERPLRDLPGESYRFVYIPTFSQPISVRVSCNEEQCVAVAKQLSGKGGYGAGHLVHQSTLEVSQEEWRDVLRVVEETRFWSISKEEYRLGIGPTDASIWALEGQKPGRRRVWVDWSLDPEKDPGIRNLCLKLLRISRLEYELSEYD